MKTFKGRMTPHDSADSFIATILIDGQWLRMMQGNRRVGAWALDDVRIERVTVFRYDITLDGATQTFSPDDPMGFADSVDVIVDLRPKSRFGLGERVRKAKEEMAATKADSAES